MVSLPEPWLPQLGNEDSRSQHNESLSGSDGVTHVKRPQWSLLSKRWLTVTAVEQGNGGW